MGGNCKVGGAVGVCMYVYTDVYVYVYVYIGGTTGFASHLKARKCKGGGVWRDLVCLVERYQETHKGERCPGEAAQGTSSTGTCICMYVYYGCMCTICVCT